MNIEIVQRRRTCPHCQSDLEHGTEAVRVDGKGPYHKWCGEIVGWMKLTPNEIRAQVRMEAPIVAQD